MKMISISQQVTNCYVDEYDDAWRQLLQVILVVLFFIFLTFRNNLYLYVYPFCFYDKSREDCFNEILNICYSS